MRVEATIELTHPRTGKERTFRVYATCTARSHSGIFDPVSGFGEPSCGNEFEDEYWYVKTPDGFYTPAHQTLIDEVASDEKNVDRLYAALDAALEEADAAEHDRWVDEQIDLKKERGHGI